MSNIGYLARNLFFRLGTLYSVQWCPAVASKKRDTAEAPLPSTFKFLLHALPLYVYSTRIQLRNSMAPSSPLHSKLEPSGDVEEKKKKTSKNRPSTVRRLYIITSRRSAGKEGRKGTCDLGHVPENFIFTRFMHMYNLNTFVWECTPKRISTNVSNRGQANGLSLFISIVYFAL